MSGNNISSTMSDKNIFILERKLERIYRKRLKKIKTSKNCNKKNAPCPTPSNSPCERREPSLERKEPSELVL